MHKQISSLLFLSMSVLYCRAQQKNITPDFDPYFIETKDTISPYGPNSITRNILQDKNGDYWLASWEGIIRYDGKLFTNFTKKAGLRHFHVFSVFEDRSGNLWFGTVRAGVYRYDGKTFTNFTIKEGLAGDIIGCMLQDKAGNIWFGTDEGISRYDGKAFTNFTTKEGLCHNSINSIEEDKTGKLWFGTGGGVCYYDGRSFTALPNREGLPFKNVRAIKEDRTGNLWIGSADGLCRYDARSIFFGVGSFANITKSFVGNVTEDKAGNIWYSAMVSHGMASYRCDARPLPNGKAIINKILEKNTDEDGQVFCVYEDKAGSIWFATMRGVCRYDGTLFTYFIQKGSK